VAGNEAVDFCKERGYSYTYQFFFSRWRDTERRSELSEKEGFVEAV